MALIHKYEERVYMFTMILFLSKEHEGTIDFITMSVLFSKYGHIENSRLRIAKCGQGGTGYD